MPGIAPCAGNFGAAACTRKMSVRPDPRQSGKRRVGQSKRAAGNPDRMELLGWAALILLAGLATLMVLNNISYLIVSGPWHDLLGTLFVMVARPTITLVLRSCIKHGLGCCSAVECQEDRDRHCEPTGRAYARPMTGSAKQSIARFWIASSLRSSQ